MIIFVIATPMRAAFADVMLDDLQKGLETTGSPSRVIRMSDASEIDGVWHDHLPYHQSDLHKAVPIYETLPGWKTDISSVTHPDDLPAAAADYIAFLEQQIGVPIRLVGVGPGREQFLDRAA